jgi:hypothetical protein
VKVILCQPAIPYLKWQLEVLLANIRQFGQHEVVLLFTEHDFTVPGYFRKKYPECEIHVYPERDNRAYIPSVRPYLWWRYLSENPARELEDYFYIDADIIFREWIDFATLGFDSTTWVGSHCKGYIAWDDYLNTLENADTIVGRMAETCGITLEQAKALPGAGAQWVISKPTADYWQRVYNDSNAIHAYFEPLNSKIQKWTAEMWAQLYGMARIGINVQTSPELDFIMPTDDLSAWDNVKILHNAGVTNMQPDLFFKGGFIDKVPFGQNFEHVRADKASIKYVDAIKKVVL